MSEKTTKILLELAQGNEAALGRLLPLVYDELKSIAGGYMGRERPDHTLSATALVNEAYLRLIDQKRVDWKGRAHFCAVAAQMMRRILVDHARRKNTKKRRAEDPLLRISVDEAVSPRGEDSEIDLIALDELLNTLGELNERHARVVELRFFAGLSIEETAHALEVSPSTIKDDWRVARAWLMTRLRP